MSISVSAADEVAAYRSDWLEEVRQRASTKPEEPIPSSV
jgi:hypothetical protein